MNSGFIDGMRYTAGNPRASPLLIVVFEHHLRKLFSRQFSVSVRVIPEHHVIIVGFPQISVVNPDPFGSVHFSQPDPGSN